MTIYGDNARSIGHTPLVRLNKVVGGGAEVLVKIEGRNPAYSVKDRVGAALIRDAEERGAIKPGMTIVEPTSGNTGIALAYVAAAKGYKICLTMPETMSIERRKVLAFLGAELVLTPGAEGIGGSVKRAEAMVAAEPEKYFMPQQFNNPANPAVHEQTTGPEIWEDTGGNIDALVCGVGTGGTITGISRYIKKQRGHSGLVTVAVEPEGSPVLTQHLAGQGLKPGPHKIQGIGAGFVPKVLDLSLVDRVETAGNDESIAFARRLAKEEGILCGISSGAAAAVAARLAALPEFAGKRIVAVLPDAAERYLSSDLFAGV